MPNKKYCLYVGRYQPYHAGHHYIINESLKQGKNVCIALRDTPISEKDPYSVEERTEMISKSFVKEMATGQVKIISIPDIESINIGRLVGYDIVRFDAPEHITGISATGIREAMSVGDPSWKENVPAGTADFFEKRQGKVLWFTGPSGAGKSTIAGILKKKLELRGKAVKILDGDELRQGISNNLGLSPEDRTEHNRRVAHLAKAIADVGAICIVALISPYTSTRTTAKEIVGSERFELVYIHSSKEDRIQRDPKGLYKKAIAGEIKGLTGYDGDFDDPADTGEDYVMIDTSIFTAEECADRLVQRLSM